MIFSISISTDENRCNEYLERKGAARDESRLSILLYVEENGYLKVRRNVVMVELGGNFSWRGRFEGTLFECRRVESGQRVFYRGIASGGYVLSMFNNYG